MDYFFVVTLFLSINLHRWKPVYFSLNGAINKPLINIISSLHTTVDTRSLLSICFLLLLLTQYLLVYVGGGDGC